MSTIWDKSLKELRESTASDKPIATAGAVSTLSATFGCALLVMVLEIQVAKINDQRKKRKALLLLDELRNKMSQLSSYPDQDITVFKTFIESFNMPEKNREQKDARVASIENHRRSVIDTPMRAAISILETYPVITKMIDITTGTLLADIACGTQLMEASLQSLLWTVQVNTRDLEEKEMKNIQRERKRIGRSAREQSEKILNLIKALT